MKNKLILLLLTLTLLQNVNAYPYRYNVTNDAYVSFANPNTNYGSDTALLVGTCFGGQPCYTYIDLGEIPVNQISLAMYEYDNAFSSNNNTAIYTTSSFDQSTINWTNKPAAIDFINSFDTVLGWNYFNFSSTSRYIVLLSVTSVFFDSSEYTFISNRTPYVLNDTPAIRGTVTFTDVNNLNYVLPNAYVTLDSTTHLTDSFGNFNFSNPSVGQHTLSVYKSEAYNSSNISLSYSSGVLFQDFNLIFSKPSIAQPYLSGNFIKGTYSNNIHTIQLWSNPNYVFGIYNIDNKTYYKSCTVVISSVFQCDIIPNQNYEFHFLFSDIYNSNLSFYHPDISGSRDFISQSLIMQNESSVLSGASGKLSKNTGRENILKTNFFTWFAILILIILIIFTLSIGEKIKRKQLYNSNK